VDLGARGTGEHRDEQADRARAEDEHPVTGPQVGSLGRAQGVAAGLDEGPEDRVDLVGQGVQRRGGYHQLLGQRTVPAAPDPDLLPVLAHVLMSGAGSGGRRRHRASCRP
jgi:hypothetical protein